MSSKAGALPDAPLRVGVLYKPNGSAGLREIYRAARSAECEVLIFLRESMIRENPDIVTAAESTFETVIFTDDHELPDCIRAAELSGFTTFHDDELESVDMTLDVTGLPGRSSLKNPWDKLVQRQQFHRFGASTVQAMGVETIDDFCRAVNVVGLPGVLKPKRGVSGSGVTFVKDNEDADRQVANRVCWEGLLYEEFMDTHESISPTTTVGDTVSVETLSTETEHVHVAIFDQLPRSIAYRGGNDSSDSVLTTGMFTPSRLPQQMRDSVLRCAAMALESLGVRWRVTHTEIRITENGPEALEVNGRIGGHVANVLCTVGGPDLVRLALLAAVASSRTTSAMPVLGRGGPMAGELYMSFPERNGSVLSRVKRSDLLGLPGATRVGRIAVYGEQRSVNSFLAFNNLLMKVGNPSEFVDQLQAVISGAAHLFSDDGLPEDPWIKRICGE